MFLRTRLHLTGWYLLIIMIVSSAFSLVIYQMLQIELDRVERQQRIRQERMMPLPLNQLPLELRQGIRGQFFIDPQLLEEAKVRLKINLLVVNIAILLVSGFASYWLAGLTLKPIQQALDAQKRFVTNASHELRTPLTALKSEIEVSLMDSKNPEPFRKLLKSNLEEVAKLEYLSDKLIRLSRIGQHLESLVDVKKIVLQGLDQVKKAALLKHIKIITKLTNFKILGDADSLVELIVIILDNAIKYSPDNSQIEVSAYHQNERFWISIRDHGVGIDSSDQAHIFDRFYRGDKARSTRQTSGYGLGLSIAKQIIEQHHGHISFDSIPSQGSVFYLDFPEPKSNG